MPKITKIVPYLVKKLCILYQHESENISIAFFSYQQNKSGGLILVIRKSLLIDK